MSKHFEARSTDAPGPRLPITLNIAEASLATLLKGIEPERCWLTKEDDGAYAFHATQTLGQSRKQPGKPASDILVELVNSFADELDAEDVPERLGDRWDQLVDEYVARTSRTTEP